MEAVQSASEIVRPAKRRWLQFSLRSMLAVTVVAALAMSSYVNWYLPWQQEQMQIVATTWDVVSGQNIKWSVNLGSQTYGRPVISDGKVFIGTNNSAAYLKRYPSNVDLGVLLCFREWDGVFLWQASSAKLPTGRVHDWPMQGVCSTPLVDGDRLWYVTNRCEVVCLDTEGFYDDENDGPFRDEPTGDRHEADVVWMFDMMGQLNVSPHNMSACTVVSAGHRLFVITSNGVDESHLNIPRPNAPSFLALDKRTGNVLWTDNSPGSNILHGQWGSPAHAVLGGVPQVLFPGGDGWLYSFDPVGDGNGGSKLLWKFDCNPKASKWILGGRGTRNELLTAPGIYKGLVYITVGQDPEHGEGIGHLWCIDPTKRGDVSAELVFNQSDPETPIAHKRLLACDADAGDFVRPNPNSAVVWHYDWQDLNGDGQKQFEEEFHRSLSRPALKNDLLVVSDFSGLVHCLDALTGKLHWSYDLYAACWCTPLISGESIYVADEDGDVAVFRLSADPNEALRLGQPIMEAIMGNAVYSTPTAANGVLFIATNHKLYAIQDR
jgi:outer membrane protein assembly factor BamB